MFGGDFATFISKLVVDAFAVTVKTFDARDAAAALGLVSCVQYATRRAGRGIKYMRRTKESGNIPSPGGVYTQYRRPMPVYAFPLPCWVSVSKRNYPVPMCEDGWSGRNWTELPEPWPSWSIGG